MAHTDHTDKTKALKTYSSTVQSLLDIWRILDQYSSKEHPMSVREIATKLKEENEEAPSSNTISRKLPSEVAAMSTLFPHKILQESDSPAVIQSYTCNNTMHVVIENKDGEVFREDDLTVILEPRNVNPPSYSTIDKLLKNFPETINGDFPFKLKCVKAVNQQGKTKYIPYSEWEELYRDDHSGNNQPRLYYLESVLTPTEWRIFSDLIQVYPYISQEQTNKFMDVLKKIAPGENNYFVTRYAFKRGSDKQFRHIAVIDKAIRDRTAIMLRYGKYKLENENGNWIPKLEDRGKPMEIEPYALMWANGYYYLVGKYKTNMINLRTDRILSVAHLERSFVRESGFDRYIHRDKSPIMYAGNPQYVKIRCKESMLNTLLDVFGSQAHFSALTDGWIDVTMTVSLEGAKLFALEYSEFVEVLEPHSLRAEVFTVLESALKRYKSV